MKKKIIKDAIERVKQMEEIFYNLKKAFDQSPSDLDRGQLEILIDYYQNGKWLFDYELDEKGYFPKDLKRGVLSQDGIYNLLTDINT